MSGLAFDPTILREYDIRGIVGETLSEDSAFHLGRAYASLLAETQGRVAGKTVCIGYDGRLSSPRLSTALQRGLTESGLNVILVGMGPTPMLYFSVHYLDADGGIQITGSHNPADYNGFKMMLGKNAVYGKTIQSLGQIAAEGRYINGQGQANENLMMDAYVARILTDFKGGKALSVAWDAGNGAAGPAMKAVSEKMPGQHFLLFEDVDGTFPNHHPDPTVEANLADLRKVVADQGCDLGIGFDGDGDRIGVIDNEGQVLWGDQLIALLSQEILEDQPGATIIADVKASQVLFDELARMGANPIMWKTGHSLIKVKMKEENAPLAGEMSGHIFYGDRYYGFDDALYVALRLLGLLSRKMAADPSLTLAKLRNSLPKVVNTPELRFECPEDRKFSIIADVRERLIRNKSDIIDIDGVRVKTDDGWWLLRASNTQPVLVARAEAKDEAGLSRLKSLLIEQLRLSGLDAPEGL